MATRKGQGSIHYDDTKKLYVGAVELPPGPDGKRRRRFVRRRTKAEVVAELRTIAAKRDDGTLVDGPAVTVEAWLAWWADNLVASHVKPSTETVYRQVVRDWIVPHIGKVQLAKLRPEHVVAMMRALEDRGLSAGSIKKARMVLRRSLTHAERFGRVSRNVVALTDAPATAAKLDDTLDAADAARVLAAASGDRLEALAVLVLAVGLRQGEALDLRWSDVDLDTGVLRVVKAKTAAGVRQVALPAFVVTCLRDHRQKQRAERMAAPVWGDPDLVFTTTIGTRIHRRNALRWWHQLTTRAKVGRRRFHASRHTAATLMLNNGVPLEVVSATLGHAGLAITADVYAKVRPELQRTAATAMENVLGGAR